MRLTQWTDYALRVLMYCAASEGRAQPVTITEMAEQHAISRSHLMKIVQALAAQGLLDTTRGRGGGLRLRVPAAEIRLGDVVRLTESDFDMVECFDPAVNRCRLTGHCLLRGVLAQATQSYLTVLDGVTLADLVARPAAAGTTSAARRRALAAVPVPGLPVRAPAEAQP